MPGPLSQDHPNPSDNVSVKTTLRSPAASIRLQLVAASLVVLATLLFAGGMALAQNAPAGAPGGTGGPGAKPGGSDAPQYLPPPCVKVDGMTFELAGSEALMVKKGEESIAIVHVNQFLPAGVFAMSFPANELCPYGPKAHFMVNNDIYSAQRIRLFDGAGETRVAVINARGTGGTIAAR